MVCKLQLKSILFLNILGGFKRLQMNLYQPESENLWQKELSGTLAIQVSYGKVRTAFVEAYHSSLTRILQTNIRNDLPERTYPRFINFWEVLHKGPNNNKKTQTKTHHHTTTHTLNKKPSQLTYKQTKNPELFWDKSHPE